MALKDKLKGPKGPKAPSDIEERLRRGRDAMRRDSAQRRLAYKFWNNEQYWYVNEKGLLHVQDTVTRVGGGGKPPHRVRNRYNFIRSAVQSKVSQATQRIPSYQVMPATADQQDAAAATLAEQVALYGYDKWRLRRITTKTVTGALVKREAFAMPYWDPNVGPFIETLTEDGKVEYVGQGEVAILTLSADEVYWEPGQDFYESRWHAVERARSIDELEQTPGFLGGKLVADATTADLPTERAKGPESNLVLVTEYLERPCPKYPRGRRLVMANGQVIFPPEDYPCMNGEGQIVDEPVLHHLSYTVDPESDRDQGFVDDLIDLQRTINDCWNKLIEWKNRRLFPKMLAPRGSDPDQLTDEPGQITYYNPTSGGPPTWEKVDGPPQELFQMLGQAVQQLRDLAADTDVQAEADVAARTVQAVIETHRARWQSFIGDLAEWHSRLMRHCLYLVQRHYTEPRKLQIQGDFGPDNIPGFMGADLRGQADIRVFPDSIEVRSRQAITQEAILFADRGWITPQAAMASIRGGAGSRLGESWQYDVARANRIIQAIKRGPETLFAMRPEYDQTGVDELGQPVFGEIPGWMPRSIDDVDVWMQVWRTWMKSASWDRLDDGMREAANLVYQALLRKQAEEQMRQMQIQTMMAEEQGMKNASKEQQAKPLPDQPKPDGPLPAGL